MQEQNVKQLASEEKSKAFLEELGRTNLSPDTYEARKKAFKAAGRRSQSQFIPMTRNNQNFFPQAAQGNNRSETNGRGVNPRMLNVQRAPVQEKIIVGTTKKDGKVVPVVALVKGMRERKIYHTRPVVSAVVPE